MEWAGPRIRLNVGSRSWFGSRQNVSPATSNARDDVQHAAASPLEASCTRAYPKRARASHATWYVPGRPGPRSDDVTGSGGEGKGRDRPGVGLRACLHACVRGCVAEASSPPSDLEGGIFAPW